MSIKKYYLEKLDKAKDDIGELSKLLQEFQPQLEKAERYGSNAEWDECVLIQHKMTDAANIWIERYNKEFGENQPLFQKLPGWVTTTVSKKTVPSASQKSFSYYQASSQETQSIPEYVNLGSGKVERSGVVDYLHINGSRVQLKDYNSYTGEAEDYEGNKYKLD